MKYRIWEQLLTEYTDFPTMMMVGEVEAESHLKAYETAKLLYPDKEIQRVDDRRTVYEFKDGVTFTRGLSS